MKHANIAIFVPHIGCPRGCAFCDQRAICGTQTAPDAKDVDEAVRVAKTAKGFNGNTAEIAFFGGSFTAIDREYMESLLSAAKRHIDDGSVSGIRISTRPDFIDDSVLSLLKAYGVTTIELGAQSMQEDVLQKNDRGHTALDVVNASKLIKKHGFSLGLQMMTGLYGDTDEKAIDTARQLIELQPDCVRIYPTVVLKHTKLASLVKSGEYAPQTLDEAVDLGAKLLELFHKADISVIRFGLHTINEDNYVAGPWHPSLAELAQGRVYLSVVLKMLSGQAKGDYILKVCRGATSKMTGQKKQNLSQLADMGYHCRVVESAELTPYEIEIEEVKTCD